MRIIQTEKSSSLDLYQPTLSWQAETEVSDIQIKLKSHFISMQTTWKVFLNDNVARAYSNVERMLYTNEKLLSSSVKETKFSPLVLDEMYAEF